MPVKQANRRAKGSGAPGVPKTPAHRKAIAEGQRERAKLAREAKVREDRLRALQQDFDDKAQTEEVPISALRGDRESLPYQREPEQARIDALAKNFDLDSIGVIYVSRREDGTLAVLDGWHRVLTLRQLGFNEPQDTITALVYDGLSIEQEAALFIAYNSERRNTSHFDLYKAQVIAGDPVYSEVQQVLDKYGVKVGPGRAKRTMRAPVMAVNSVRRHGDGKLLDAAIEVALEAFPDDPDALGRNLIEGLMLVLNRLSDHPNFDRSRLVKRISRSKSIHLTASEVAEDGARIKQESRGSYRSAEAQAIALIRLYNYGLNNEKKLPQEGVLGGWRVTSKK